jgi:hypothetical protein
MLTMVSIIFGGLYFDETTLPAPLRWLPAASPVKRTWEGLVANEFADFAFDDAPQRRWWWWLLGSADRPVKYADGAAVLAEAGIGAETVGRSALLLSAALVALHAMAYCALVLKAPRFSQPTDPDAARQRPLNAR